MKSGPNTSILFLVVLGLGVFAGCATQNTMPITPKPPGMLTPTLEELVISKAKSNEFSRDLPSFTNSTLGLNEFSKEGGAMVTDMVALELVKKKHIKMVDREHIQEIVSEIERTAEGLYKMSEFQRLKKIGELAGADYLLFGSVTEFNTDNMQIALDKYFKDGEEERYEKEYNEFSSKLDTIEESINQNIQGMQMAGIFTMGLSNMGVYAAQDQRRELTKLRSKVKSLEYYQDKLRGRRRFVTVANVGITAKLIRVETGKIAWVFQISKRDMDLKQGMKILVDALLDSLLKKSAEK